MSGILSDVATIERISSIEAELKMLRADAYRRAGIPLPSENKQVGRIIEFAGIAFGVSDGAILGPARPERVCRARFAIAWVAREAFGLSSTVIGRALGDRDHSTIPGAQARAEEMRAIDDEYRDITDRLLALMVPKKVHEEEAENAQRHH